MWSSSSTTPASFAAEQLYHGHDRSRQTPQQHHAPQQQAASAGTDQQQLLADPADQLRWRVFEQQHYSKCAQLDTVFYVIHLLMSAVHKRVLVTSREQLGFELAMAIFAGALLLRLFFRPLYMRIRPQLVFVIHVLVTLLRGFVVFTMASKQAVHARAAMVTEETDTVGILAATMLAILGGPFRLFEALGLQQSWTAHVWVSLLYLLVHPWAAADGMRMAYSNAMFYLVRATHDTVAAVADGLLGMLLGAPSAGQQTCSSCAGVAVYGFMCLYGSVAVPLYILYMREQWAFHCWVKQSPNAAATVTVAAADATASPAYASSSSSSSRGSTQDTEAVAYVQPVSQGAVGGSAEAAAAAPFVGACNTHFWSGGSATGLGNCKACQQIRAAAGSCGTTMASSSSTPAKWEVHSRGSSSSNRSRSRVSSTASRLEAMCVKAEQVAAEQSPVCGQALSLGHVMGSSNALARWCVHLSALVCMLVGCWVLSNAFALVLLPRMLSSQQLQRWCPNRPLAPFVIAGQVYEGL